MATLDDVTIELMEVNSNLNTLSDNLKFSTEYDNLLIDVTKKQFDRLINFLKESQKPSLADLEMQREARSGAVPAAAGAAAGGTGTALDVGTVGGTAAGGFLGLKAAGIGIGAGALAGGVGILAGGGAYLLSTLEDLDTKKLKENVDDLLAIGNSFEGGSLNFLKEGGIFTAVMAGLGGGLLAFSLGSGAANIADTFSKEGWAQRIKDNVTTLLSISDEVSDEDATLLGKAGAFGLSMAGIGAGLTIFAIGQLANSLANTFSSEGWAKSIKDNVKELLSITDLLADGDGETSKAGMFAAGMAKVAAGLLAFTGSKAIGQLASVGEAILGFFGAESPFDQIMQVADKAEDLNKGAGAIEKIAKALNALGNIKVSDIDIDFVDLAENLGKAIPFLDALANGGEVKGSGTWLTDPLVFEKGLLDPSLRMDELAKQMEKVNYVLGTGERPVEQMQRVDSPPAVSRYQNLSNEELILKATQEAKETARERAMTNNAMNNNIVNNVNNNSSTVVVPSPAPTRQPNSPSEALWNAGGNFAP